jgi:prepilin-type N-terminal cleavage/methylation domain-containing protein
MKRGFTLIELLIVVAIIAILAAIAVPNFLEAQTRAKVARVKGELRTLATAIESYTVDNNSEPPEAGNGPNTGVYAPLNPLLGQTGSFTGILTPAITTPIAYITTFTFVDPFLTADKAVDADVLLYTYKSYRAEWPLKATPKDDTQPIGFNEGTFLSGAKFQELYGRWRLFSVGPDRFWDNKPTGGNHVTSPSSVGLPYDATNGTVSLGSIVRSQKEPEQKTWVLVNGQ